MSQAGKLKVSEKNSSQFINDKKIINGYKKQILKLTPENLDLHVSKSVEAKILDFKLVGLCFVQDEDSLKDEDLKKLAIILNSSANKIHTLALNFDRYESKTYVGFDAICHSLRKMTSLKSLRLSFKYRDFVPDLMRDERLLKLCRALKTLSSLQSISIDFFRSDKLTEMGFGKLFHTLRTLSSLRNIELKFDQNSSCVIVDLGKSLKKLSLLKNLTLKLEGCNEVLDYGLQSFGQGLKTLGSLQALDLNFRGPKCTDAGFEAFFQGIKSLASLRKINLGFDSDPNLNNIVISKIAKSLEKLSSLKNVKLDLKWSNLAEKEAFEIGQALKSLPDLERLTLKFGKSTTDRVVSALGKELKSIGNLQSLDLQFAGPEITDEGIKEISQIFGELPLLKRLGLEFPDCQKISKTGLGHLCQELKKLVSLQELSLDFSGIWGLAIPGIKLLGKALKTLKPLKSFSLNLHGEGGGTGVVGLQNLCQGLKAHTSLQSFELNLTSLNHISDKEVKFLAKTLKTFTNLEKISLDFVGLGAYEGLAEEELTFVAEAFKKLIRLEKVSIGFLCPGTSVKNFSEFVEAFKTLRYLETLNLDYFVLDWDEEIHFENGFKTLKNLPNMREFEFNEEIP